mmetsp:Transcript_52670/g.136414  ORF Transcript_52670/g.136414 Transcript_52670/m.136414 type:complete len:202 (+) Transcript_52670:798-1403(+)
MPPSSCMPAVFFMTMESSCGFDFSMLVAYVTVATSSRTGKGKLFAWSLRSPPSYTENLRPIHADETQPRYEAECSGSASGSASRIDFTNASTAALLYRLLAAACRRPVCTVRTLKASASAGAAVLPAIRPSSSPCGSGLASEGAAASAAPADSDAEVPVLAAVTATADAIPGGAKMWKSPSPGHRCRAMSSTWPSCSETSR